MNSVLDLLSALPPLVALLIKVTAVLGAGWAGHLLLLRANPRWRVLLRRGVLTGLLLLPASAWLGAVRIGVQPPIADESTYAAPVAMPVAAMGFGAGDLPAGPELEMGTAISAVSNIPEPLDVESRFDVSMTWFQERWPWLLAVGWALGVTLLGVRLTMACVRLRGIVQTSRPVSSSIQALADRIANQLGYARQVRVRVTSAVASPLLTGLRRPAILLPERMARPNYSQELPAVLAHELAHLSAGDLPWLLATRWTTILLWPHPLVWGILNSHASACEEVSDAVAAKHAGDVAAYVRTLARTALEVIGSPLVPIGVPMARSSEITRRLWALQTRINASPLARRWSALALASGLALGALVGGLRLVQAQSATDAPVASTAPESLPPGARLLHFPPDRSLGQLYVQDANLQRRIESVYYQINGTGWETFQCLGEAKGDVVVPVGKRLALFISAAGARDLSPLDRLAPDDVFAVWTYTELSDKAMAQLAHLSGLREIDLVCKGTTRPKTTCSMTPAGLKCLKALTKLEYLTLPAQATDAHLAAVAGLRSLKGLYCCDVNLITNKGLAVLGQLERLEELALVGEKIGDAGLAHLAQLPKLQYLNLWPKNFTDAGMAHLAKIPSLKILNVGGLPLGDKAMAHIGRIAGLERLALYHNSAITDAGIAHLTRLRNLHYLDISQAAVTAKGLVRLKAIRTLEQLRLPPMIATDALLDELTKLPRLKELHLPLNYSRVNAEIHYSDKSLERIAERLPRMEELFLGGHGVTDAGLARLGTLKGLKRLYLFGVPNITDEGMASLASISTLENLELHFAEKITTRGVNHFNHLTNLRRLRVGRQPPQGFCDETLNLSGLTRLQHLELASARDQDLACLSGLTQLAWFEISTSELKISDEGMVHLAPLTNLNRLIIGGINMTDRGLANLAGMKKMESLTVIGNFTDAGLRHLEGLTGVRSLNVRSSNTFSPGAIERLKASLPSCFGFNVTQDRALPAPTGPKVTKKDVGGKAEGSAHPKPGATAPLFEVTTLDGKPWRLADQRGKVVILYFWGTFCKPCMAEMPKLNQFYMDLKQRFGDKVEMLGLAMDDNGPQLQAVVEAKKVTWPQARIGTLSKIAADYGVMGAPDEFMIGPDGKVLLNEESPDATDTMTVIAAALKKAGANKE